MSQSNNAERNGHDGPARGAESRRALRGFASMDPERRRRISSVGGKAVHAKGTGHEFTSEEARAAGRKGGVARALARKVGAGAPSPVIPFPVTKKD